MLQHTLRALLFIVRRIACATITNATTGITSPNCDPTIATSGNAVIATFGYDFLSNLAKHRVLNDTEMKLWANYLKVYDPELKKPLPRGYAREAVVKLMNEPYQ